jgi:hypothetical protein
MKPFLFAVSLVLSALCFRAQPCQLNYVEDTLYVPLLNKTINAQYTEVKTKNNSQIQLFKQGNNYYLRIIATVNLYFGKTDLLEIKSDKMSFFAKNTKQFERDRDHGSYTIQVYKNYIATLKDYGITGIKFGAAETKYESKDAEAVRKMAKCFYEEINAKK